MSKSKQLVPPSLKNLKQSEPTIFVGDENHDVELVKIYGLQRSGTNWLTFLINENFQNVRVLVNEGGWKHGHYMIPWTMGKETHVVSLIKNPYSWLVSVYNYWGPNRKKNIGPDLRGVEFEDFVRNRYLAEKQRGIPFLLRAKNPIQHWNNMNIHWLSLRLSNKRSCFITYETLMENLGQSLTIVGQSLGIKPKYENKWVDNDKTFLPGDDNQWKTADEVCDREYYKNQGWKSHYTPELLEFVNSELDLDLMVQFGYMPMQPEELC